MKATNAMVVLTAMATLCAGVRAQDCPSFVKKDDVTTGDRADVPSGWFLYSDCDVNNAGATGLYRSPTNTFNAERIAGTEGDGPCDIDITGDGEWILYFGSKSQKLVFIRPDGSGRTPVPTPGCSGGAGFAGSPRGGGLYRNSPKGLEVYYLAAWDELRSIEVDLSGDTPAFGADRTIVKWGNGMLFQDYGFETDINVAANHVYCRQINKSPYYRAKAFFTIPDGGSGTASAADRWLYSDLPSTSIFGCGFTMSHDGGRIVSGWGAQGTTCVPSHANHLDHKGFVLEKFREPGEPSVSINDIETYGISVNFCPDKYRFGAFNEVDFSRWYWSNNDSLIVGTLAGSRAPDPGVWLVNWVTNTWTRLTDGNLQLYAAAVHFDRVVANRLGDGGRATAAAYRRIGGGEYAIHDVRGRLVPGGARTVSLPAGAYIQVQNQTTRRMVVNP